MKSKTKIKKKCMKNVKNNINGITLIALIITVIILLILAGVSISALTGEDGLLNRARDAKQTMENSSIAENEILASYENELNDYQGGVTNPPSTTEEVIDKATPYVGYYADIDGDKEPDGVIYADLAVSVSGQWINSDGAFSYEAITGTKDYYVSKTNHNGAFGTKDVLTATGSGADRFYVMALEDFNTGTAYCWYDAAYDSRISDYSTVTSTSFGTGKTNTSTMIAKWNSSTYGAQNDNSSRADIWGAIKDEVADGWFVPSKEEWSAFGYNLGITLKHYDSYWSSSLYNGGYAWTVNSIAESVTNGCVNGWIYVRLSATF